MASLLTTDFKGFEQTYKQLIDNISDTQLSALNDRIGAIMVVAVLKNFEDEKGIPAPDIWGVESKRKSWVKLKPATIKRRKALGQIDQGIFKSSRGTISYVKKLDATGALRKSIKIVEHDKIVSVGSDVVYAAAQNYGYAPKNIPPRPFLNISAEAFLKIEAIINAALMRSIRHYP
jgi:phage gpG-like protein